MLGQGTRTAQAHVIIATRVADGRRTCRNAGGVKATPRWRCGARCRDTFTLGRQRVKSSLTPLRRRHPHRPRWKRNSGERPEPTPRGLEDTSNVSFTPSPAGSAVHLGASDVLSCGSRRGFPPPTPSRWLGPANRQPTHWPDRFVAGVTRPGQCRDTVAAQSPSSTALLICRAVNGCSRRVAQMTSV